jgi:hypothetical protein
LPENAINDILHGVVDQFQTFARGIGEAAQMRRTRDELTDILIRFLVSGDAFAGKPLPVDNPGFD